MGKSFSLPLIKIIPARFKARESWWWFLFFLFCLFVFPSPSWGAMSFVFSGTPLAVAGDEEFEVQVSLIAAPPNRVYFLRAAFFKAGSSDYFGFTLNNQGSWHNSAGEPGQFLEINTGETGDWTGSLKAKADLEAAGFKGEGDYLFKVGRYTEGGSLSWSDNEEELTIIVEPTPSPTPALTSLPSPTPEATSSPTPIPTPTPTLMPTPGPYSGEGIFLNEFMPDPAEGEEWVEIKNENDFEVYLSDWFLDDISDGGSRPLKFSARILGGGLEVIYAGTRFNNSGDLVRLIGQGGEEVDAYPYDKVKKGYSFAKDENGNWQLTLDPTPGEENKIVGLPLPSPSSTPSPTASPFLPSLATASPSPTGLIDSLSVLGLSDRSLASPAKTATESGLLTGGTCPLVDELERGFWALKNSFSGPDQNEDRPESNSQRSFLPLGFSFLGLMVMVGSYGFFLKETGFLVKWGHGLVAKD